MDEEQIQQEYNALKEHLQRYGEDNGFWLRKASLLMEIGESSDAEKILCNLTENEPQFADAWYLLGQVYFARNNLERGFLAFARAARLLDSSSEEYREFVESVLGLEGMPEGGADFFRTLLLCERHTFIFVVPVEFQRVMVQRYQNMAIALSELGQEVIFVNTQQQNAAVLDEISDRELLYRIIDGEERDGDVIMYRPCIHERALDILLSFLGSKYPDAVFFIGVPDNFETVERLCESHLVICDIADDNSDFEGAFWTTLERYQCERQVAKMSFAVTVSSATLFCREYLLEHISDTYLIPNGVDQEEISPEQEEEPQDIAHIPHPRIGYVGVVYQRFDRELLYRLAERNPGWSFVLIGTILEEWITAKYPNIYLLGGRPHWMLSQYYKSFDVALIPYKDDAKMSLSCDPVKLYEHISCNLPTVTSYMPDTYLGKPLTWHGNTVDSVQAELEHILSEKPRLSKLEQSDFLFQNSWLTRCAGLIRIVEKRQVESDFPKHVLEYMKRKFEKHRAEHLNLERLYALSHIRERFEDFEQCYTESVKGHEISFDRDMQAQLSELKTCESTLRYMEECKHEANAKVLLIVGYFGHDNFGDELLLDALFERIKQRPHIHPVAAGYGSAEHTQKLHHVPAICLLDEGIVRQAVLHSDMILLGPGGLLDDRAGIELKKKLLPYGIFTYLFPLALAREAEKPMFAVGLGVDSFVTESAKALVQDIFPMMKYLGVRDEYSQHCLEKIGVKNARISQDMSFLYEEGRLAQTKGESEKKILGVNLRSIATEEAGEIVRAASYFLRDGWNIWFIAAQNGVDNQILNLCVRAFWDSGIPDVKKNVRLLIPKSVEEALETISGVSMMLAMRLHINVMAWQMSVPSLFLAYDAKGEAMARQLGLEAYWLPVSGCKAGEIIELLSDLWMNRRKLLGRVTQRIEVMREWAEQEFERVLEGMS